MRLYELKDIKKEVPDFDDLVFENRNKEYGAFLLRKSYNIVVIISIIIGSFLGSFVVIIPYLHALGTKHDSGQGIKIRYVQVQMDKIQPPPKEIVIPPVASPPPPSAQTSIKYVAPVVADSVLPLEKPQPTVADVQASNPENNQLAVTGTGNQNDLIPGQDGENSEEPFFMIEVNPTFKGGDLDKFREWVRRRTIYPQLAQDNGIKGKVYLTFVVERDGTVSNVKVVKGVDKLLDDEAVKAIESSPKWSPGLQRGRPVRVRFSIYLNFNL
jgi:protein TonB